MQPLKNNKLFVTLFLIWEILLLIFSRIHPKGQEFFMLKSIYHHFLDAFFKIITLLGEWPAFLLAICVLGLRLRARGFLLVAALGILVPVSSKLTKTYFKHPRPGLYFKDHPGFQQLHHIKGVKPYMGNTSFPSGHTLSAFAVFSLLAFYSGKKGIWVVSFLLLAVLVGLSRIYLRQHFVEDVCMGAALGTLLAVFLCQIDIFLNKENNMLTPH
jgi:membrane-associated phospholipid phosphatase